MLISNSMIGRIMSKYELLLLQRHLKNAKRFYHMRKKDIPEDAKIARAYDEARDECAQLLARIDLLLGKL